MKLDEVDRLYIIPGKTDKTGRVVVTHLAYYEERRWLDRGLYQLCLPNLPVFMCNCESACPTKHHEECGMEADRQYAEYFDQFYNEVTCLTCLKRARGKETPLPLKIPSLREALSG